MHFYITGDTHGNFNRIEEFCSENDTTKEDVMIILGDAGINYWLDNTDRQLKNDLSSLDITLFCVHGNHEARPWEAGDCIWHLPTAGFAEQNGRNAKLNGRLPFDY